MKIFPVASDEDLRSIDTCLTLNPQEEEYAAELDRRFQHYSSEDYLGRINFLLEEMGRFEKLFPKSVALNCEFYGLFGKLHEQMGDHVLDKENYLEGSVYYAKAVFYYHLIDETLGRSTSYSLRQSEACRGVAVSRLGAGISDDITQWFLDRSNQLLSNLFGINFSVVGREAIPLSANLVADSGIVKVYTVDGKPQGEA